MLLSEDADAPENAVAVWSQVHGGAQFVRKSGLLKKGDAVALLAQKDGGRQTPDASTDDHHVQTIAAAFGVPVGHGRDTVGPCVIYSRVHGDRQNK